MKTFKIVLIVGSFFHLTNVSEIKIKINVCWRLGEGNVATEGPVIMVGFCILIMIIVTINVHRSMYIYK